MIPHIPRQRQDARPTRAFDDLVAYIEENQEQTLQLEEAIDPQFSSLLEYAINPTDKLTNVAKCLAIRTHGLTDISTAAIEMNAVAAHNTRCKDPAFHFILSWPEHEQPPAAAIFDAAEHAIKALGLADHQYVLAIHGNTDNRHCHIAVNRVHPITFKAQHIEWAKKTLHMAARQSEIKHGWFHDNGIYIVETDGQGRKTIVLNKDLAAAIGDLEPHAHREDRESALPAWHDPDSLETWLKTSVAWPLKRALPDLQTWHALHAFLDQHGIALSDTGGGGMRLTVTSHETGEVLELPASKGLRMLKRADLERRWGQFLAATETPCIVPDTSHLTPTQLAQGAQDVLDRNADPRTPHDNILHLAANRSRLAADRSGGLHELSARSLDARRASGEVLLPDALHLHMGIDQARQDQDLRRPGAGPGSRGSEGERLGVDTARTRQRNDAQREQRRLERAAARTDLRQRYAQYKRFVRLGDTDHSIRLKALQGERRKAVAELAKESRDAKRAARKRPGADASTKLLAIVAIDAETARRKLEIESRYQHRAQEQRATHQPPLGWREWLHEQSNLGDQAAISALRGIVYQAQRDAKKGDRAPLDDDLDEERAARDAAYREEQHQKVIARLLDEEKNEIAIRAARSNAMRPHELDALLTRYAGIQWRVTGNGNIEYSDRAGAHLFTDRGNRVTFDRARVTDQDIKLALVHAQQKFGRQITLTGNDPVFTARMARLADDMGLVVLNPDIQSVIATHRKEPRQPQRPPHTVTPAPERHKPQTPSIQSTSLSAQPDKEATPPKSVIAPAEPFVPLAPDLPVLEPVPVLTLADQLRAKVLAIDPHATFIDPDPADNHRQYTGPVAANVAQAFAQHIGRHQYALHAAPAPIHDLDTILDIRYRDQKPQITTLKTKGKGRAE